MSGSFGTLAFLGASASPSELIVIALVVLVLFGPRRLPEIARTIGKVLNELRRASQEFRDQIMSIDEEPGTAPPAQPFPDTEEGDDDHAGPQELDDTAGENDAGSGAVDESVAGGQPTPG